MTNADHEYPDPRAVRVIRRADCSADTPQTHGIRRLVALDGKTVPDSQLSAFVSSVQPHTWTAAHHHGTQDTVLFVLTGRAASPGGRNWKTSSGQQAGDFVVTPAGVVHQEINPSPDEVTEWVVVRSGAQPIVVNLVQLDQLAEDRAAACLTLATITPAQAGRHGHADTGTPTRHTNIVTPTRATGARPRRQTVNTEQALADLGIPRPSSPTSSARNWTKTGTSSCRTT